MRIGIDASSLVGASPTGLELALAQLLERLPGAGPAHEFALHLCFVRRECAARFQERVVPLLRDRMRAHVCRIPARWLNRMDRLYRTEWTLGVCDVVHYPTPVLRRQSRGARVVTIHDVIAMSHAEHYPPGLVQTWREQLRRAARESDLLITVSHSTRSAVIDRLGVAPERVRVAHNGVDRRFRPAPAHRIRELRTRLGLSRPYLLAVGVGDPRKNIARLVDAFAVLRERGVKDVDLVLAGKPWIATPGVQECILRRGLGDCVRTPGYVADADLPTLYSGAELFAFPSLAEGFGLPALEALACETPLLASAASALPEIVGQAGLLVDPTCVDALAEAMHALLHDSALREGLITRGRTRARAFSWEAAAHETIAAYEAAA